LVSGAIWALFIVGVLHLLGWCNLGNGLVGLCAISLHYGFLWAIGEFRKDDIDFFVDTFNPKKMLNFIAQGIRK
jgi:hypothetical protein